MEPLQEHQQEIAYSFVRATGFEKRFVWDSVIEQAFTQVEDHVTGVRYNVYPREGAHPKLTYERPQTQHIIYLAEEALAETVQLSPVKTKQKNFGLTGGELDGEAKGETREINTDGYESD